jgi:hypothetical protein
MLVEDLEANMTVYEYMGWLAFLESRAKREADSMSGKNNLLAGSKGDLIKGLTGGR